MHIVYYISTHAWMDAWPRSTTGTTAALRSSLPTRGATPFCPCKWVFIKGNNVDIKGNNGGIPIPAASNIYSKGCLGTLLS